MNIRLYYPDSIVENSTNLLSKEHTHYIINVMRLKRGSILNLFNNKCEWESEIVFLQVQKKTFFDCSALNIKGEKSVPL